MRSRGLTIRQELEADLLHHFTPVTLTKGEYYHSADMVCRRIAFLRTGQIVHYYNVEGKMMTRWISLPDSFVTTFTSFLRQEPSRDNLLCITDCELLACPRDAFFSMMHRHEGLRQFWISALENNMIGYEDRVRQLITRNAERRYQYFIAQYPNLIQSVPQKYIASMLGIEPRHLSRIRNKLAKRK